MDTMVANIAIHYRGKAGQMIHHYVGPLFAHVLFSPQETDIDSFYYASSFSFVPWEEMLRHFKPK